VALKCSSTPPNSRIDYLATGGLPTSSAKRSNRVEQIGVLVDPPFRSAHGGFHRNASNGAWASGDRRRYAVRGEVLIERHPADTTTVEHWVVRWSVPIRCVGMQPVALCANNSGT
jgi:hypothetical protein